jgi:hypothetical protein
MSIYTEKGFRDRRHYLQFLSEIYIVELETVILLASLYGEQEDFKTLVESITEISQGA